MWDNGAWKQLDLATIPQGNFVWPDGRPWDRSDDRAIMRIRRPALDTVDLEPVPYSRDLHWPLGCDCYWDYDDSLNDGPPPGNVRFAVRTVARAEVGDDTPLYFTDPVEAERFRTDQLAEARETVERHRKWLRGQIRTHGWPRAGVDSHATAGLVLVWVATDPNPKARAQSVAKLLEAVAAGTADPTYLAVLEDGIELPLESLVERFHTGCRTPFPPHPAGAAAAAAAASVAP